MNIEQISTSAASVATIHADLQAAKAAELAAEAELLDKVVGTIRPSLAGLSSRILATDWATGCGTASVKVGKTYHRAVRAVLVSGRSTAERDCPRDNEGGMEGSGLFLGTDGTWVEVEWSGTWSNWQGRGWSAESKIRTLTTAEVVADYAVDPIVEALAEALSRYLAGKATDTARKSRERAAKLQALAALLG
jgi:hypothetical protein